MPQIIVTAGPTGQHGGDVVMLRERVNPADFESEQFAANLVERLGWAVSDATEAEQREPSGLVRTPTREGDREPEHERPADRRPLVTA
jgi:hypothetical protein